MNDFQIFVWASDYENFTGEGLLARLYIENNFSLSNKKIQIYSNTGRYFFYKKKNITIKRSPYVNTFTKKYLYSFYGIFLIWYFHFKGKQIYFVNYLPLWAFWIFFLLPKKTILGPITGATYKKNIYTFNNLIRRFIFPLFYFLSIKIIFLKFKKVIFSTDNLKNFVPKSRIKYCLFNFCLLFYKKRKLKRKDIDFLFYLRSHSNKSNNFHKSIINSLLDLKLKIVVVGDKFEKLNVKNYINIPRKRLLTLLDKTKFTITSDENFYSLFAIDCFSSNVFVFYNKFIKPRNFFFEKNLLNEINFSDVHCSLKRIINIILDRNKIRNFKINSNNTLNLLNINKRFTNQFIKK
jgi:hypothetical protein